MVHAAVRFPRPSVHADEERGVATGLEEHVLVTGMYDPVAAARQLGHERVEGELLAGAVAIHDDDLVPPAALAPRTAALISSV